MKRHITIALIALNIAACFALPQNQAPVAMEEESAVSIVGIKGDLDSLQGMQNDQMVRTCINNECKVMSVGETKGLNAEAIQAMFSMKGNEETTKALGPAVERLGESVKGLNAQKAMLEALQAQMASMTSAFSKGQEVNDNAKGQMAEIMSKGVSFAPAPPMKGYAAPMPPSKGGSGANTMALEAAMCPMTMYELGKCQKLSAEQRSQITSANAMNAMLMGQKTQCENELAVTKAQKQRAEDQAAFNAKYAAEQKAQVEALTMALAMANAEKAALQADKEQLEEALQTTQDALIAEKETTAALSVALQQCNEDKAQLQDEVDALKTELDDTRRTLRETQRALVKEQNDHDRTKRELAATQTELEATERARQVLEEANLELEKEVRETKEQLDTMTLERDQLQLNLDATSALLAACTEERLQCEAELAQKTAEAEQLAKQLTDALTMLAAEKLAREELMKTIMEVKAASEKVQEEVRKLQLENVQLQQQVMKLKAESEAALAMASGCPPTYEKFGLSCYKYIREKTQWKMAQEQCMKDGGNLVSVESKREQAFLVDYLKRHGAEDSDAYSHTSGNKQMNHWKWLGSSEVYMGQTGPTYWFNEITKMKPGYDCQAMYLRDSAQYGKWVGLPCYSNAPFTCEYRIAPPGTPEPANAAETMAAMQMYQEAPAYLKYPVSNKGSLAFAPPSKGFQMAPASKGLAYAPQTKGLSFANKGSYRRL